MVPASFSFSADQSSAEDSSPNTSFIDYRAFHNRDKHVKLLVESNTMKMC